ATHVWEVSGGTLSTHTGGWAEYVAARERRLAAARAAPGAAPPARPALPPAAPGGANGSSRRLRETEAARARIARRERDGAAAQEAVRALDAAIAEASAAGDGKRIAELGHQHVAATAALAGLEDEWLALADAADGAAV